MNNFNKRAQEYEAKASIQKIIALDLFKFIKNNNYNLALDLGCGPGVKFLKLKYYAQNVIGIDLAPNMVKLANEKAIPQTLALTLDAHNLSSLPSILANHKDFLKLDESQISNFKFDLIYSSLALQWCDFDKILNEITKISRHKTYITFAIPTEGTICELKEIFNKVNLNANFNTFININKIKELLLKHNLTNLKVFEKIYHDDFYDFKSYLASIREIGAILSNTKHKSLSKKEYLALINEFNDILKLNKKLTHSYHITFIYGEI